MVDPTRTQLQVLKPAAAFLLAMSIAACGVVELPGANVPDRPDNVNAVAPFVLVAQGSGPAGGYRVWAYRTTDGMACIELGSIDGASSACDPTGRPPLDGSGVNRSADGVIVWADTGEAAAATAVVHDASGADVRVALVDVGPTMAGIKVAIANLGTSANPVSIDFLDPSGSKVASVRLR